MATKIKDTKGITAIFIIIIGIGLLLRNLNLFPESFPSYIFTWPMILIIIGFFNLIGKNDVTSGFILISIGMFFLLPNALGVPMHEIFKYWPILLIIAGVSFLFKKRPYNNFKRLQSSNTGDDSSGSIDMGRIEMTAVFGGTKNVMDPMEFKGGSITSIFGGNEIDLSQCTLAEGRNYLEINAIFGGAVIIVPNDWNILIEVTPILGGFNDQRWHNPSFVKDIDRILIIKGTLIFGGGELKSR